MELSSASRCIAIFEMTIAGNVVHGSTDKSFISNIATSKSKLGPMTSSFKQEMRTKKDVNESSTKLCNNIIGCTILVQTVDTNDEIAAVVDNDLLATAGTPIKDDDNIPTNTTVRSMKSTSPPAQQRGLFCSWEEQEKSINASRRKPSLNCSQDMMRLKDRLHNLQQLQQQQAQKSQKKKNLDESSTTITTATWLETCSI